MDQDEERSPWHNLTPEQRAKFIPMKPEEPRLDDGSPLYHALVRTTESGRAIDPVEAKQRLSRIAETNPEAIAACQGKTALEARKILEEAEAEISKKPN